jgi:methylmalonyl-CoA mutase cobalamin-binding domain/chain
LAQQVIAELAQRGLEDEIPVVVGGTISPKDAKALREMGVADVFGVRSPLDELAPRVQLLVKSDR